MPKRSTYQHKLCRWFTLSSKSWLGWSDLNWRNAEIKIQCVRPLHHTPTYAQGTRRDTKPPSVAENNTAIECTSLMSVLCILGFLFRDANRIYKQTSLFTGGSSQSRTAINRATIYRLTVGLTIHIVAIGESNSGRLDGAVYGIRTRDISLEGWDVATTLILQNKVY